MNPTSNDTRNRISGALATRTPGGINLWAAFFPVGRPAQVGREKLIAKRRESRARPTWKVGLPRTYLRAADSIRISWRHFEQFHIRQQPNRNGRHVLFGVPVRAPVIPDQWMFLINEGRQGQRGKACRAGQRARPR